MRESEQLKETIKTLIEEILGEQKKTEVLIPVEASGRHVHLSKTDWKKLFGGDPTQARELSQPGQYLYKEKVRLVGPRGVIDRVAVLGPSREKTQVEITLTDARTLGLKGVLKDSGDLEGAESLWIAANDVLVNAKESTLVARRHLHMHPSDAERFGVQDGQLVSVAIAASRPATFHKVLVRVNPNYRLALHIDYDEANALGWAGEKARLVVGEGP